MSDRDAVESCLTSLNGNGSAEFQNIVVATRERRLMTIATVSTSPSSFRGFVAAQRTSFTAAAPLGSNAPI
jgi:hypothetical protein